MLGKCISSSLPARLMVEFTASKVHLQPTTYNLTYWEFSQQTCVQTLLASLGVLGVVKARKSAFQWGLGRGRGRGRNSSLHLCVLGGGRCFRQIAHSSYPRHRIPSYTLHYLFPSNTFLQGHIIFPISQPARICLKNRYFEEHIHWVPLIVEKTVNNNVIKMGNVYLRDE